MTFEVRLSPLAIEDLIEVHRWVQAEAGQATADAYLNRIEARISSLSDFPDRGSPRNDLVIGLRTLGFERRLMIAYMTDSQASSVTVMRVINGARVLGPLLDS